MRDLLPAPAHLIDPSTGRARTGSFVGHFPSLDLGAIGPRGWRRITREKRWFYGLLRKDATLLGLAIVDLGYALKAFAFAHREGEKTLAADRSVLGAPGMGQVRQTDAFAYLAKVSHPLGRFHVELPRGSDAMRIDVRARGFRIDAELDVRVGPPAITAVAPIEGGVMNATEKRVLLPLRGEASIDGMRISLDGGTGGFDYTHGLLARHTAWRWAFFLGRARGGGPVALNLVEGFVGEPECAVWVDGAPIGIGEGRFRFDADRPLSPWSITSTDGVLDLEFRPDAIHQEHENLLLVSSRFIQPVGSFRGVIRLPGQDPIELEDARGVAESQDVRW